MAAPEAAPTPPFPTQRRSRLGAARARHRSPLRRRNDTLRTWLRTSMVLGLLTAASLSALIGLLSYQTHRATAVRHEGQLHKVQALALTDATRSQGNATAARIRYTDLVGAVHEARLTVPATTAQGDRFPLWLNDRNQASTPPDSLADSASAAVCLGVLTLIGTAIVIVAAQTLARARLERTNLRHWEREWLQIEPAWSHRNQSP
ncbi:uncharacterized membrane protein YidH (DUF202 family) [Streptacidiphilus sp. MAP12-16]|uniref:Rv1733c family protein n=1 Tax=Streptacidiphilus sp. MAP12-16 TaxID=3156300 RepID=UPI003516B566